MVEFLLHLFLSAGLLLVVASLIEGISIKGWGSAILGVLVLGFVNAFVRPVMVLLTLPITVFTFGLFLLVVNAVMLWLAASVVPGLRVRGFMPAFWASLLLTILNLGVSFLLGPAWVS